MRLSGYRFVLALNLALKVSKFSYDFDRQFLRYTLNYDSRKLHTRITQSRRRGRCD